MVNLGLKLPRIGENPRLTRGKSAGEWGKRAEELGYESLWAAETWGANVFIDLAEVAMQTDNLRFGTHIANVYSRSPAVLAMGAGSLAHLSEGRAILGLGASHPNFVEGLHNVEYDRPVRRTHELIELIRALVTGKETVEYQGQLFSVEGYESLNEEVLIYNAALGETNRRATGRVADGWIPFLIPVSHLNKAFETVAVTARKAGRNPDDITVVPQIMAVVDNDLETARYPIQEFVATYIGNYEAYRSMIAKRFPDQTAEIADAWEANEQEAAKQLVTDEMLQEFGVAGTPETARSRLREILANNVIDSAIVFVPTGVSRETLDRTVDALSPENFD